MTQGQQELVTVGRIGRIYGIKGWVKLISYTDPQDNILDFRHLLVRTGGQWTPLEMDQSKLHGKGLIAHFAGCDDPDQARTLAGLELAVHVQDLPDLAPEEFYWHELIGMRVETVGGLLFGNVAKLLETGANDVLVVQPCKGSIDGRERLIPYLPERVVLTVSREQKKITVDWEPEYLA